MLRSMLLKTISRHRLKMGTSSENDMPSDTKCTFEELLLSTVKQYNPPEKVKKTKVASGAEVITAKEASNRLQEIHDTKKNKKKRSHGEVYQTIEPEENEQEEEMILDDSDDDIEEEMREEETLVASMKEISKPLNEITENDWVLVCLSGKKSKRYYVGQIICSANNEYGDFEVKFTKKVPTLDPMSSSTFIWKCPEECAFIAREDIILSLPSPYFGRRG